MSTRTAPPRRRTVALRPEPFTDTGLQAMGYETLTALARAAGISPSTLARCQRGELAPGPVVIGSLLATTGKRFNQLFRLTLA